MAGAFKRNHGETIFARAADHGNFLAASMAFRPFLPCFYVL
jgi:hypothetical protein